MLDDLALFVDEVAAALALARDQVLARVEADERVHDAAGRARPEPRRVVRLGRTQRHDRARRALAEQLPAVVLILARAAPSRKLAGALRVRPRGVALNGEEVVSVRMPGVSGT
jgi:hypothetical protein